jgi:hypothetical protein
MNQTFEEPEEDDIEEPEVADEEEDIPEPEQLEASLEEILSKRTEPVEAEEEEDSIFEMTPEERVESLAVRAVPKQANEFVCASCHLVKHNSQLADRKRQLCRDCV